MREVGQASNASRFDSSAFESDRPTMKDRQSSVPPPRPSLMLRETTSFTEEKSSSANLSHTRAKARTPIGPQLNRSRTPQFLSRCSNHKCTLAVACIFRRLAARRFDNLHGALRIAAKCYRCLVQQGLRAMIHLVLDLAIRTVGSGGLLGGKDALKYSIKAARSLGSTKAPHLIILSPSFVQLFSLRRCWRIMLASWHSVQAV